MKVREWDKHKYVARVPINNSKTKFRYFYDEDEYRAYLGQNKTNTTINGSNTVANVQEDIRRSKLNDKYANPETLKGSEKMVYDLLRMPYLKGEKLDFSVINKKDRVYTNDEDMSLVNPNYDDGSNDAYSLNCARCSAAYELRCRGYDVEARAWNPDHDVTTAIEETFDISVQTETNILKWYDGEHMLTSHDLYRKYKDFSHTDDEVIWDTYKTELFEKEVLSYGDGARGQLHLFWDGGGAHSVVWEVNNNKIIIRDCQSNEIIPSFEERYAWYIESFSLFRTDNININKDILLVVQNRKRK